MISWGDHQLVATARSGSWDDFKIGGGAVPFRVRSNGVDGWLAVYHGVTQSSGAYSLGALLLDANDPARVIARSRDPILAPEATYERSGFYGGVVFTCGLLAEDDRVRIYYGAADGVTAVADLSLAWILSGLDATRELFELGVNYWPKRRAMYMWREFDLGEVRDDFAQIADIGFDVVRIFALTQDFLPGPLSVAREMVGRLVEVVRVAKDAGLKVVPTLIVLNMSGRIWWPAWMLDAAGEPADLFSDPTLLRSQTLLVEQCASALAGDSCVRAFDLTNEIDDAQRPRTRDAGRLWASLLADSR